MRIIRPTEITGAMIGACNVPENDHPEYVAGTTYALDALVIRASTHRRYKSLQAGNIGHMPESSPTWWLDIGPTNRWAMFDSSTSSQTAIANSLTLTIAPGQVDSIGFVNIDATDITITMTNGGSTVYNKTIDLSLMTIHDWYEYFFEPFKFKHDLAVLDLPNFPAGVISITMNNVGSSVKCGGMIFGRRKILGLTQWEPKISIVDYSRKDTDPFGNVTLIKRAFSNRMECAVFIDNPEVDGIKQILADFRASAILWSASDDFDSLTLFGYYKDFDIVITSPAGSMCNLTIEGLV